MASPRAARAPVGLVARVGGLLLLDGRVPDKPDAQRMALVARQRSGEHQRVVWGIGLVPLLPRDGLTAHGHARVLLAMVLPRPPARHPHLHRRPNCVTAMTKER